MDNVSRKGLLLGFVGILLAGLTISAFAANLTVNSDDNAGQGVGIVEGYYADGFIYRTAAENTDSDDGSGLITEVEFTLWKDQDNQGISTVTDENTDVFVQIRVSGEPGNSGDWASCTVTTEPVPGTVLCSMNGEQQKTLDEMSGLGIVAYDVIPD